MKTLIWLLLFLTALEASAEPLLKGSDASQRRQNAVADYYGLVRIENDEQLEEMIRAGLLVKIPESTGIKIDKRLPENLHYVLSYVVDYLTKLGRDFYKEFGAELQINSAVRTIIYQAHLGGVRKISNAASPYGEKRSSHLTGATIDIAKLPLTKEQLIWMRKRLVAEEINYILEATEEHRQAVFHIMIFPEAVAPHIFMVANSKWTNHSKVDPTRVDFLFTEERPL